MLKASDRSIPRTMATQHPDNARAPYWHHSALVTAAEEVKESVVSWRELGCEEVKWDWEGKLVEETVLERLFSTETQYFAQHPLGSAHFLTFRIPHPAKEKGGRYWRALTSVATAQALVEQLSLDRSPMMEVILPMTTSAEEIIRVHQDLEELTIYYASKFKVSTPTQPSALQVIPLVESIEALSQYDRIIEGYTDWYAHHFKQKLISFRPYIARSDPALQSGLLAAVLVSKLALSRIHEVGRKKAVEMYPIIGVGSLPFRGGLSPITASEMEKEYQGVATFTIQSAFRYDYDSQIVRKSIKVMNSAPFRTAPQLTKEEEDFLHRSIAIASHSYQQALAPLLPLFPLVSPFIPKRRERFSSQNSVFAYDRTTQGVSLPRAISFTAILYSIGLPPELLGMGSALHEIAQLSKGTKFLEQLYPSLASHLQTAGHYLNKENLAQLIKKYPSLQKVAEDIRRTEELLGIEFEPTTSEEQQHYQLSSEIISQLFSAQTTQLVTNIEQAAKLRKSIG